MEEDEFDEVWGGDSFYESLPNLQFDEYWKKLDESGWLKGLKDSRINEIKCSVKEYFESDSLEMLPDALADFILEFDYFAESYTDLLHMFEKHSNGAFSTSDVKEDEIEESRTELAFIANNVQHKCTLNYTVDDINIIEFVNDILRKSGSKKIFMPLNRGRNQDDIVNYAFVDPESFSRAVGLGIMPDENY